MMKSVIVGTIAGSFIYASYGILFFLMYGNRITDSAMKYLQSDLVEAHKNNDIQNILIGTKNDLIYCIIEENAPLITNELRTKTTQNTCNNACFQNSKKLIPEKKQCIDNCEQDDTYKYEIDNICYYIPYYITLYSSCN